MNSKLLDKIYEKTDGGKDIYTFFDEGLSKYIGSTTKFKFREGENTASARFYSSKTSSGTQFWRLVDFGDHGFSPFDFYVEQKGYGYMPFPEVVKRMAQDFGVTESLRADVNKPIVEFRLAGADEPDYIYEFHSRIPEGWLRVLGAKVTREHAEALNWHACTFLGHKFKDKNGVMKMCIEKTTETFPIFMRECKVEGGKSFYKVYKPLNPDKGGRFLYVGEKPERYICGLAELQQYLRENPREETADKEAFPERTKLFICSGERDALCVKSQGEHPIWFNSETYNLSREEYKMLASLVDDVYNIPDIDETGVRRGNLLALAYPYVKTVWLPESMKEFKDARGKYHKDFRDWMECHQSRYEFDNLVDTALPAKFWSIDKDKNGNYHPSIHPMETYHFLRLNGFYTIHDENCTTPRIIRVQGNVISEQNPKDVRNFVRRWAHEHALPKPVLDVLTKTPVLADNALENLKEIDPDFTNCTKDSQTYYFKGNAIVVTAEGIKVISGNCIDSAHYVWAKNVFKFKFKKLDSMFHITHVAKGNGEFDWDIELSDKVTSNVLKYLVNTSRMYWGEESNMAAFKIDSPELSAEQIREQKLNLISKIQGIGYLFHRYKTHLHIWAPLLLDGKIGENGQCNGRSGKSFLMNALSKFLAIHTLDGRNEDIMKNSHVFGSVKESTQLILFDDCSEKFDFNRFYSMQSEALPINPKGVQDTTIPFEESPKFCFSSNYVPNDMSASSTARRFYMVFSDYYHQKSDENDYNETRTLQTDFGKELFDSSYTEEEWNQDANFFMQCLQFYLQICKEDMRLKVEPPMGNIMQRMRKQQMGENFEEWANIYFSEESGHLDIMLPREEMFDNFMRCANFQKMTANGFKKKLEAYCKFASHIDSLNPSDVTGGKSRLIQRVVVGGVAKAAEVFYVRSAKAAQRRREASAQMEISFPGEHIPPQAC